jgi:hypothetical protein
LLGFKTFGDLLCATSAAAENFLGMLHFGCCLICLILLRYL